MHPVELLKMGKSAFNSSRKKLGLPVGSAVILPGIPGLGWEEEEKEAEREEQEEDWREKWGRAPDSSSHLCGQRWS